MTTSKYTDMQFPLWRLLRSSGLSPTRALPLPLPRRLLRRPWPPLRATRPWGVPRWSCCPRRWRCCRRVLGAAAAGCCCRMLQHGGVVTFALECPATHEAGLPLILRCPPPCRRRAGRWMCQTATAMRRRARSQTCARASSAACASTPGRWAPLPKCWPPCAPSHCEHASQPAGSVLSSAAAAWSAMPVANSGIALMCNDAQPW